MATAKTSGLLGWIDERFPFSSAWKEHLTEYYASKNFNYQTGACRGSCSIGPELIVDGKHYGRMTPEKIEDVLKQ